MQPLCVSRTFVAKEEYHKGTNSVGVDKEQRITLVNAIAIESGHCGIDWVFNTPGNPAAGGA